MTPWTYLGYIIVVLLDLIFKPPHGLPFGAIRPGDDDTWVEDLPGEYGLKHEVIIVTKQTTCLIGNVKIDIIKKFPFISLRINISKIVVCIDYIWYHSH